MPVLKNHKHEEFCHEIALGKSQAEAYRAAGYSERGAKQGASRLLTNVDLQARIEEIRANIARLDAEREARIEAKVGVTKAWVIDKLTTNVNRSLQETPVLDHEGNPTGEYTYQGNVANKALELIGKELGMFKDSPTEIKGDVHLHFGTNAPTWAEEPTE